MGFFLSKGKRILKHMTTTSMTFEHFKEIAKAGAIVPVFRRMNADLITPVLAYLKIRNKDNFSFLFESVIKGEHLGRYSFIGSDPVRIIESTEGDSDFFQQLQDSLKNYHPVIVDELPRFTCGAVGFIGYDMIRQIENLPDSKYDPIRISNAVMAFYYNLIAFDHLKNQVIIIANVFVKENSDANELYQEANQRLDDIVQKLTSPLKINISFFADSKNFTSNFPSTDFKKAVETAKEHIFAGDIFQVVLSQRMEMSYKGDIFQVYRSLRNINPSPYLFFLDFLDYQLIGSSPEPLIRVEDGEAEIIPIAGTRPRGRNREEDLIHEDSLLSDPKELAEHVMLVDLARNDMGHVSTHGSIQVEDFKTIERYSHVMHIISRVKGKLDMQYDAVDAFQAAFPAGTVSGAPKIRAMQIINELEPEKRGFYSGAIGYFDYNGNMDMCIAIRTMLAKNNKIYLQAGAGIVADSIPENEFQETINKANALKSAIELATGGFNDSFY